MRIYAPVTKNGLFECTHPSKPTKRIRAVDAGNAKYVYGKRQQINYLHPQLVVVEIEPTQRRWPQSAWPRQ